MSVPDVTLWSTSTQFAAATVSVVVTSVFYSFWKHSRYPRGPTPLPIIGNLLWTTKGGNIMKRLADSTKEYGSVITMFFETPTVFLNTKEALYEGFVKNANHLSERPDDLNPVYQLTQGMGIINEKPGNWQTLRRQLLAVFKEKGVGKVGMEECITHELKYFTKSLEEKDQQAFDVKNLLTQAVSNMATRIIFGTRFDYSDDQLENLQFDEFVEKAFLIEHFPFLQYLPGDPTGYYAAKAKAEKGCKFARQQIEAHRQDFDPASPRDYIDAFLSEMEKQGKEGGPFNESNLLAAVMQLYIAGTDTTSTNLYWSFLYLVLYPEIQEKIINEIDEHIGDREPLYSDRNQLHFTQSFIMEILRKASAFTSLPHQTSADVIIQGSKIPKGTRVMGNIWAVCHDEETFTDARTFKADRFLDADGKFVKPDARTMVPFSIGRRACPGEPLAKMEMLLFLVVALQKFRVELCQEDRPDEEGHRKFLMQPKEFFVKFVPRT